MAATELLMPKLGLTMTEGLLAEWLVEPGVSFAQGDVVVVIETDKVANELEAPCGGVLDEQLIKEGETVDVGTPIARWSLSDPNAVMVLPVDEDELTESVSEPESKAEQVLQADSKPDSAANAAPAQTGSQKGDRIIATPYARKQAEAQGIDLNQIKGSGPNGRIKAADLGIESGAVDADSKLDLGRRTPASPAQRALARRLAQSKQNTPHFYLSSEAEISELLTLRKAYNENPDKPHLTLTHLLVRAAGLALKAHPESNRVWDDGEIVSYDSSDVGIVVNLPEGLAVPQLRAAGDLPLAEIALAADVLLAQARSGSLGHDELTGGALSISNAGMFDVTYLTPVINPGQAAMLGVGSVRELFRPDEAGQPTLRREMGLVLACDHRILDGVSGVVLLNAIKQQLECPESELFSDLLSN
ncbi:MAG: 2-oxo acid dehydrogenase subunit E2 [Gammaproteobacteria bacterium]|nr:2-oxo acid dehydrogenase subunit E2 [Gammaproteobacteria bacterium]